MPVFTHAELKALWEAVAQAQENRDPEDGERANDATDSALEKLDNYVAQFAA